jgi:hypothetical protein
MLLKGLRYLALAVVFLVGAIFLVRAYEAVSGPPLAPWHSFVPDEPDAETIDGMDWAAWSEREAAIFASVREAVVERLDPEERVASNRYFDGAPMHPWRFETDWNRSFVLMPDGPPRGAVVLLHGLTDAPYSLRHIAGSTARAALPPSPCGCRGTARCLAASPPPRPASGAPPRASPSARPRASPVPTRRCTWSATRTAGRWRRSTRSRRSTSQACPCPTSSFSSPR